MRPNNAMQLICGYTTHNLLYTYFIDCDKSAAIITPPQTIPASKLD